VEGQGLLWVLAVFAVFGERIRAEKKEEGPDLGKTKNWLAGITSCRSGNKGGAPTETCNEAGNKKRTQWSHEQADFYY